MNHNKDNTRRRPMEVPKEKFESEWDRIFGNKKDQEDKKKEDTTN